MNQPNVRSTTQRLGSTCEGASLFLFWQHWLDQFPLSVGQISRIWGDFYRLDLTPQRIAEILKLYPSTEISSHSAHFGCFPALSFAVTPLSGHDHKFFLDLLHGWCERRMSIVIFPDDWSLFCVDPGTFRHVSKIMVKLKILANFLVNVLLIF